MPLFFFFFWLGSLKLVCETKRVAVDDDDFPLMYLLGKVSSWKHHVSNPQLNCYLKN